MRAYVWTLAALGVAVTANLARAQGGLTPPGAPAPSMKTLAQVEPRIPITNLPFVISQPGSYYATTNLTLSVAGTGIVVNANDVSIDLNGFQLNGPGASSSIGVLQQPWFRNLTLVRGNLSGWGQCAVSADGSAGRFAFLTLSGNASGLYAGPKSQISDCTASDSSFPAFFSLIFGFMAAESCTLQRCAAIANTGNNMAIGFYVLSNSIVSDCVASGNAGSTYAYGFSLSAGCTASRCVSDNNSGGSDTGGGGIGFLLQEHCRLSDAQARFNSHYGIYAAARCQLSGCLAATNSAKDGFYVGTGGIVRDCIATANHEAGIDVTGDNNLVTGCNSSGNRAAGIYVKGHRNRIEDNQCAYNDWGVYFDPSGLTDYNLAVRNSAFSNTSGNYGIGIGNILAPIDSYRAFTNAWSNFSY